MAHDAKSGRVVDLDFRVCGYDNVYVVDASVFPSSIGTNPQWTIMACSSIAAKKVAAAHAASGDLPRSARPRSSAGALPAAE
jgi:choline dehydrogenase-like flavoprotein